MFQIPDLIVDLQCSNVLCGLLYVERSAILSVESNDDTVSKNILSDGQQLYLVPNDDTVSKNTVSIISTCPCR